MIEKNGALPDAVSLCPWFNNIFHIRKCLFFTLISQHRNQLFKLRRCSRVHKSFASSLFKILQRFGIGISIREIDLACSHSITKHLYHISYRHADGFFFPGLHVVIVPVLKVMLVPALVMQPGSRVAFMEPGSHVRAFVRPVVHYTLEKLGRGVL